MSSNKKNLNNIDLKSSKAKIALYICTVKNCDHIVQNQKDWLMRFINQQGYTNYRFYIDKGTTNKRTLYKPAMINLISDISTQNIDIVVVVSMNQISSNINDIREWMDIVSEYNVQCISLI